jgi:general secretion pathway protein J
MGVLAVLCWRGLDTVLRSRDGINRSSDELRALTAAFGQIDNDLRSSWSMRLFKIRSRDPIVFSRIDVDAPIALELLRESGSRDELFRIQQVIYRLRGGQLERGFAPWQPPGSSGAGEPRDRPMTWQPLLSDVSAIEMRAWIEQQRAWFDAKSLVGAAPSTAASASVVSAAASTAASTGGAAAGEAAAVAGAMTTGRTVTGVEVALARRGGGRIVRVFSVKD